MKIGTFTYILLALIVSAGTVAIYPAWQRSQPLALSLKEQAEQEVLYLPSGEALKFISLGYQNALADFFWFTTINYFGKHFRSDKSYEWLAHRCGLIQVLDPKYLYVAEFCALILAYEARDAAAARKILKRALQADPENWRLYYLLGMNYLLFEKNDHAAQRYFVLSSQQPEAEPFVARLAAKKTYELSNPQIALDFLRNLIGNARNEDQRTALIRHYQKTFVEVRVAQLEKLVEQYNSKASTPLKNLNELRALNIDVLLFKDPFGGYYYYDEKDKKIKRTTTDEMKKGIKR